MTIFQKVWSVIKTKGLSWQGAPGAVVGGSSVLFNPRGHKPEHNSAIAACLSTITDAIVEAPWQARREQDNDDDPEILKKHPVLQLLRRPNPFMTGRRLVQALAWSYKFDGNAYALKVWNATRTKVVELWFVPHFAIEPRCRPGQEAQFITHYDVTTIQGVKPYPVDDIIHLRLGTDPENPRKGLSPLRALVKEYKADDAAADFALDTLNNMGVAGLFLSPSDPATRLSADFKAELLAQVKEKTTGRNRGGSFAFSQGIKVDSIGKSPKDVQVGELRRIPEERISAVLNVPAIVAGLGAGLARSTFANMSEARRMFTESCLGPMWISFAEECGAQLLPNFDGMPIPNEGKADSATDRLAFDTSKVKALQEDEDDKHSRYRADFQACMLKLGEARSALGYETDDSEKDLWFSDFQPGAPAEDPHKTASAAKVKRHLRLQMRSSREAFENEQLGDDE